MLIDVMHSDGELIWRGEVVKSELRALKKLYEKKGFAFAPTQISNIGVETFNECLMFLKGEEF